MKSRIKTSCLCGYIGRKRILGVILLLLVSFSSGKADGQPVLTSRSEGKSFMISFDDGPARSSTPYILGQLRGILNSAGYPVRVGFFLIGKDKSKSRIFDIWSCEKKIRLPFTSRFRDDICPDPGIEENPDIVRAIELDGHYVLVHGQHHADLSRLARDEVESEVLGCYEELMKAGARPLKFFRPPYLSNPAIPSDSILVREGWKIVSGVPSGDGSPFADEESVTKSCRRSIERAGTYPVLLIFHDFRGLPGHRFDFRKIIGTLTSSAYELLDFNPETMGRRLGSLP
jgi:peptidoglycan/xylan/chitin deacetylase (PgdA/CDA1 family)